MAEEAGGGAGTTPGCALIIGGTRGLGFELATSAARRGLHTVVFGRSAEALAGTAFERRALDLCAPGEVASVDVGMPGPGYVMWVAGAFLKGRLADTSVADIDGLSRLLFTGPVALLRRILLTAPRPLHLVTIASSSSWKRREREALYCGLKAAQATFTRNLVPELAEEAAGNKVTLVNPGGLAVPDFHSGLDIDFGKMMDPHEVAEIVWRIAAEQRDPFQEVQILRSREPGSEGAPLVSWGARTPQTPQTPQTPSES